ncbi:MAG: enoyl-CoA hydratase/isomerase family protein [Pseudomonadota bacterium]|nr:enoyl-CoA hydratase/isomerase family protein [Pseudomonadota bacterium]
MKTDDLSCTVLPAHNGGIGLITLQRPQLLNALTLSMCSEIDAHLQMWEQDPEINAVIIRGEGERAFCAGGDIRFLYENGPDNIEPALEFFRLEYQMNRRIFHFTKPYIALLHGVTMGGGLGVSIHGSHRVAAESLMMAMPETGIGFFPDVGGSYFLPRLPGKTGWYLGLTGARINADDAYYAGLIDFIIAASDFATVIDELCLLDLTQESHHQISSILKRWQLPVNISHLAEQQPDIDRCFAGVTFEEIAEHLRQSASPWCHQILQELKTKSPSSLRITCKQLADGAQLDFDQCMEMELKIAEVCLKHPDLYEGVRAAVIDKDRNPRFLGLIP